MNTETNSSVRGLNIVLGVWLVISAFLWPHSSAQMNNAWICGVLAVIFAAVALRAPQIRFLNTILSVWLFISAFALPTVSVGTSWNSALVAIAMFIVSVIPGTDLTRLGTTRRTGAYGV